MIGGVLSVKGRCWEKLLDFFACQFFCFFFTYGCIFFGRADCGFLFIPASREKQNLKETETQVQVFYMDASVKVQTPRMNEDKPLARKNFMSKQKRESPTSSWEEWRKTRWDKKNKIKTTLLESLWTFQWCVSQSARNYDEARSTTLLREWKKKDDNLKIF